MLNTSCAIIISHFESIDFLRACVRQTRKHKIESIQQRIIIADQSAQKTHKDVVDEFGASEDILVVKTSPKYSGYGLDYILRFIDIPEKYIVQLHSDSFAISDAWISLPIALIEEYNLSFVGQLQFISKSTDTIYPPGPFFAMAQCFNVAKTETYKEMSLEAGFTRFHNRPQAGMTWNNNDWGRWADKDYKHRGSDDDVVAFHWEDKYRQHDKLGLAITGYVHPHFGRIIEDTVFHFGSARESVGVMEKMPQQYQDYYKKIQENYSDELIDEMISLAKANRPPTLEILTRNFWDGTKKISSPPTEEINKRIEELKNGVD